MRKRDTTLVLVAFCMFALPRYEASAQMPTRRASAITASELVWAGGCGDGVIAPGEECDPGIPGVSEPNLGGKTCESEGYSGGELGCTPAGRGSGCKLDRSACYCETATKFPATGQTTCWDSEGNLVDCAGTGQDGDVRAGAPLVYTDNGDGTITDDNTGLMWEKKNWNIFSVHIWYNEYSFETSFTDFIDRLNNTCEGEGLARCDSDDFCGAGGQCGFAGYRDWRMPNVKELMSIVDYSRYDPAVHPVFNTGCIWGCWDCSCTASGGYGTSSSFARSGSVAFEVYFSDGQLWGISKDPSRHRGYVRAVRGGK